MECDADVPCYDITFNNVNLWTDDGSDYVTWSCINAYGDGACLQEADDDDDLDTYTTKVTVTSTP
jgi:rhamnogalacturonan hydrolase